MTYHAKREPRKIEKPLQSTELKDLVDDFDAKFIDVDQDTMFEGRVCTSEFSDPK